MTEAIAGLRLAAPKADAKTTNFADLSAADILSGVSADTRAALAASLAPKASDDGKQGEEIKPAKGKDKPKNDAETEASAHESHPAFAAGFTAATTRMTAVFAAENITGNEKKAAKLLGNPKLSADEIVDLLGEEQGGANAMLDAIKAKNPNLGTGGGDDLAASSAADNHGWGKATASINKRMERN